MIRIITDSAADITLQEAEKLGIEILTLAITFEDGQCPQETEEDFSVFYRRLAACRQLPTTSQVSPEQYLRSYEAAREAGDDVIVLALSGGLSGTVHCAETAKTLCGYDRIFIVDTLQAISTQRMMVEHAVLLRSQGMAAEAIVSRLEDLRTRLTVSGVVDTLTNLRKGGRIPSSLAILGNALRVKPVIALQSAKLVAIGKALGRKAGIRMLFERFEKYPPDPAFPIIFGYTSDRSLTEEFMQEIVEKYGLQEFTLRLCPVGGVIGTHVGDNCIAIAYCAQEPINI